MHFSRLLLAGLGSLVLLSAPVQSHAAQSYDNCTGYIDSLPATISTQGTWCLRSNLSTAMTSGAAITIAASNVVLDCNDFKVGGLAGGPSTMATGVRAEGRNNITVRQCHVRGFYYGIAIEGVGGGHLVENNRIDQTLSGGIYLSGDTSLVRGNRVFDTGGFPGDAVAWGIRAQADIIDNIVAGVHAQAVDSFPPLVYGIEVMADGHEVRGNHVRGLVPGEGTAYGIKANAFGATFTGNRVSNTAGGILTGSGIQANGGICTGNTVTWFEHPFETCAQSSHNLSLPAP